MGDTTRDLSLSLAQQVLSSTRSHPLTSRADY